MSRMMWCEYVKNFSSIFLRISLSTLDYMLSTSCVYTIVLSFSRL